VELQQHNLTVLTEIYFLSPFIMVHAFKQISGNCFKKDEKSQISNYRPISLLTGFSKIFELLIFQRLEHHLLNNHILVSEQYGFKDNVSTESVIFKITDLILKA
jgi:hypothetical protein